MDVKPVNMTKKDVNLPPSIYKLIVYRLSLNKTYLDDSDGWLVCHPKQKS